MSAPPVAADPDQTALAALEAALCGLWANVLRIASVDRDSDFFLMGGDSLRGAALLEQVRAVFGVELPVARLFEEASTVAGMAGAIARAQAQRRSRGRPAVIPRRPSGASIPLTHAQARVWFLHRLEPTSDAYHESRLWFVDGPLDEPALDRAIRMVCERQSALRTRVEVVRGEPRQVVGEVPARLLEVVDLCADPGRLDDEVRRRVEAPFDLAAGGPVRFALFRLAPERHALLRVWHHIISDGLSSPVLQRDLGEAYAASRAGRAPRWETLAVDYADYALWLADDLAGPALESTTAYWKSRLADLPPLDLPADRVRPRLQSFRGDVVTRTLPRATGEALKALAREHGATPFMAYLAAFEALVGRLAGATDFAIGTPVAGRPLPELVPLVGFFANTVVVRADLAGEPTGVQLIERTRVRVLEALEHQRMPFERLVDALGGPRDPSRNPVFQIAFGMREHGRNELALEGARVRRDAARHGRAKFDLSTTVLDGPEATIVHWEYCTDLYERASVERMAAQFETLVESLVREPQRPVFALPLMDAPTRERCVVEFNRTARPYPDTGTIHARVAALAAATPDARFAGQSTYAALDARAGRLAAALRDAGVRRGTRVAVCHARVEDIATSWLAVLKAGGAYVPIDPDLPAERIAFQFEDSAIGHLLADEVVATRLVRPGVTLVRADGRSTVGAVLSAPDDAAGPDDAAYVIYTSGSTGTPKGVVVPHRAVLRLVCGADFVELRADDRIGALANPAFDASTFEFWGALCNGASLVPIAKSTAVSPRDLAAVLAAERVSVLFVTTALVHATARERPDAFRGCRALLFGGEAVDPSRIREILRAGPPRRLLHVYGPTETTTFATWHEVQEVREDAVTIPIGRPIANTTAFVLRTDGEPCAPGEPGEIWIGGPGVALGYQGRADRTAERFAERTIAPWPPARLYRTGDRARMRDDATIEFLGRADRQIKLRGHRIELDEVEAAVTRLPQVREAVVDVRGDTSETRRIVAWLVAADTDAPPPTNLARELRRHLPEVMLPAAFVWLPALPLNTNGKVDRRALPEPGGAVQGAAGLRVPARDMFEGVLLRIWEEVLGVAGLGVLDRFFEVGGHSLLAAKLVDAVERETGCRVPLTSMFVDDTVAGMARALRDGAPQASGPIVVVRAEGTRPPFVFLHGDFAAGGFYSRNLALALGDDQPALIVHPHGLLDARVPDTIEVMAAERVDALVATRPSAAYVLGGHCNGALVAFEMARQLAVRGHRVPLIVLIEAQAPRERSGEPGGDGGFVRVGTGGRAQLLSARDRASELDLKFRRAIDRYQGAPWSGRVAVIQAADRDRGSADAGWTRLAPDLEAHRVPGDHVTLITRHMAELASVVRGAIDRALEDRR